MNRTFKQFTIQAGGTPQPLVGTWVTATTAPATADVQGSTLTTIPVNDSSMFQSGDWALFLSAALGSIERVMVQSVPDGTHIKVIGLVNTRTGGAFGTGDFVQLSGSCNSIYAQTKPGNAGTIYVGTQGMAKAGLVKVISQLLAVGAATQPTELSDTRYYAADASQMSDWWIDGTTGDGYNPSFGVA